ncbi:Spx/MgsR family RNA polymerase-binding regulatory protein [Frateuria aurantia]
MSARLYGLKNCDTCRKAQRWLERFEVPFEFVDYRAQPVDGDTLRHWAGAVGGWDALVNKSGTTWRGLLPQRKQPGTDAEWVLLIREHPALVRRPVVVLDDGSISLGFSDNGFKTRFGK